MIDNKVRGAYASVGTLSVTEQAEWYRRAAGERGIGTFEILLQAGVALSGGLRSAGGYPIAGLLNEVRRIKRNEDIA